MISLIIATITSILHTPRPKIFGMLRCLWTYDNQVSATAIQNVDISSSWSFFFSFPRESFERKSQTASPISQMKPIYSPTGTDRWVEASELLSLANRLSYLQYRIGSGPVVSTPESKPNLWSQKIKDPISALCSSSMASVMMGCVCLRNITAAESSFLISHIHSW